MVAAALLAAFGGGLAAPRVGKVEAFLSNPPAIGAGALPKLKTEGRALAGEADPGTAWVGLTEASADKGPLGSRIEPASPVIAAHAPTSRSTY